MSSIVPEFRGGRSADDVCRPGGALPLPGRGNSARSCWAWWRERGLVGPRLHLQRAARSVLTRSRSPSLEDFQGKRIRAHSGRAREHGQRAGRQPGEHAGIGALPGPRGRGSSAGPSRPSPLPRRIEYHEVTALHDGRSGSAPSPSPVVINAGTLEGPLRRRCRSSPRRRSRGNPPEREALAEQSRGSCAVAWVDGGIEIITSRCRGSAPAGRNNYEAVYEDVAEPRRYRADRTDPQQSTDPARLSGAGEPALRPRRRLPTEVGYGKRRRTRNVRRRAGAHRILGRGPGSGVPRRRSVFVSVVLRYGFALFDIRVRRTGAVLRSFLGAFVAASRLLHHEGHVTGSTFCW